MCVCARARALLCAPQLSEILNEVEDDSPSGSEHSFPVGDSREGREDGIPSAVPTWPHTPQNSGLIHFSRRLARPGDDAKEEDGEEVQEAAEHGGQRRAHLFNGIQRDQQTQGELAVAAAEGREEVCGEAGGRRPALASSFAYTLA